MQTSVLKLDIVYYCPNYSKSTVFHIILVLVLCTVSDNEKHMYNHKYQNGNANEYKAGTMWLCNQTRHTAY